jgi:hypothetical protein
MYNCAASGLAGLAGLGSVSNDCMLTNNEQMVLIGLHCSCNTFMHSVPSVYTFGWNTWRRGPRRQRSECMHRVHSRALPRS